ncbi:MAG: ABC transporter permease subunit, partial [Oscillospiraceae bacterium]
MKRSKSSTVLASQEALYTRQKGGFWPEFKKNKLLFLMIAPATILLFIFAYVPMFGIIIAFKDFQYNLGVFKSPWVGLGNFKYFFESGMAWMLTKNTLFYNITFLILGTVFRITLAIFISEMIGNRTKKTMQSIMIFPYFMSWVIVGGFAFSLLNYEYGAINNILSAIGIDKIDVYNSPGVWKYILTFTNLWKETGYGTIFYLAAITGISPELYEAAYLDGAGLFKRIIHITIPMLIPTVVILLLLSLSGILKGNFDMFYQMIGNNG